MSTILITRFAIELSEKTSFFQTKEGLDWFNHRLWLFNNICLPSVITQKTAPDLWLIYITKNSKLNSKLLQSTSEHHFIKVIQLSHFEPFKSSISQTLKKIDLIKSCTIRLDCDDAIYPDFITNIKRNINQSSVDTLYEPRKGLNILINDISVIKAAFLIKKLPPFLGFINISGVDLHAFSFDHDKWPTLTNRIIFEEQPQWIQSSHNQNVSNKFGWGWLVYRVHEVNPISIQPLIPSVNVVSTHKLILFIRNILNLIKSTLKYLSK